MRQVHRTDDTFTKLFGKNYSKFYEAFQQGITTPEVCQSVPTTVPAKRHSVAPSNRASKRRRQDDRLSPPQVDQHEAPVISLQRSAATADKYPTGAKPSEVESPPSDVGDSSVRSTPKSYSAAKGKFISTINVPFACSANSYFRRLSWITNHNFIDRTAIKAKRCGPLRWELGIRNRRGESTRILECSEKDCGCRRKNHPARIRQADVEREYKGHWESHPLLI